MSIYGRVYALDVGSCIINNVYNIPILFAGTAQRLSAGLMMKGREFESPQERLDFPPPPLQCQPSVPILILVSVPPPCYRSGT